MHFIRMNINTIIFNSKTIELTVQFVVIWVLDLLCVTGFLQYQLGNTDVYNIVVSIQFSPMVENASLMCKETLEY